MRRGETVRIISDLYGDAGKTGTVYDVAESGQMGMLVQVRTGDKTNTKDVAKCKE